MNLGIAALDGHGKVVAGLLIAVAALVVLGPAGAAPVPAATIQVYPRISALPVSSEFSVQVRPSGGSWVSVDAYAIQVDLDDPSVASLAEFSMAGGPVDVQVTSLTGPIHSAVVEPASAELSPSIGPDGTTATFTLKRPTSLSFESNGDRLENLQLFANPIDTSPPARGSPHVVYFGPGTHLLPGDHQLSVPSNTTVYLAPGAFVQGSLAVMNAQNVVVRGDGIIQPYPYFTSAGGAAGVFVNHSSHVGIEDITILRGQNGATAIANSHDVVVDDVKEVTADRFSDGMDIVSSSNILVDHCFLRTSDDSIGIFGTSPYGTVGGSDSITVRDSVLWPDVAHGVLIGTFGKPGGTDEIKGVNFENIDVLNENVSEDIYQGAVALDSGDSLTVHDIQFQDLRIAPISLGQALNIRVFLNPTYDSLPGRAVRDILFRDVSIAAGDDDPSLISGYAEDQTVSDVVFENLRRAGQLVLNASDGHFDVGPYTSGIVFEADQRFDLVDDGRPAFAYTSGWSSARDGAAYGRSVHRSSLAGSKLTLRFSGREARLRGPVGPGGGLFDVYVDGAYDRTVDTYAAVSSERRILFDTGMLARGSHTVEVRVDGAHDALSSGAAVAIDAAELVP
jgi:Glycosyl hydrolases family 28